MLVYGITAAVGNILGGKLTDSMGVNRANILIISGIVVVVLGMWLLSSSPVSMGILVALLGMVTFAAVPALQARLIGVAEQHAPHAHGVAAGLNIAGFRYSAGISTGQHYYKPRRYRVYRYQRCDCFSARPAVAACTNPSQPQS